MRSKSTRRPVNPPIGAPAERRCRLFAAAMVALACACSAPPSPFGPDRLLLITVDTLRADRLEAFGSTLDLTPRIDSLADQSVVFSAAYAAAPFTLPSISAVMTGRYPEELGIQRNESMLPPSIPTLASSLKEHGWRTRAVVGNFVLRRSSGIDNGFDHFDDEFPQREVVREWPERIASDTTDAALALLDDCAAAPATPCFLWVHYQDPHGPYTPPADLLAEELEKQGRLPDFDRVLPESRDHSGKGAIPNYQIIGDRRDVGFYRASYNAEIRYLDAEFGRLLDGLTDRDLDSRTLVVFAADHGEGLGEDDFWFAHGEFLDDALVRVPLLFRVPGREPDRRDDVASTIDILPTVLGALGLGVLESDAEGRDLLAPDAAEHASRPYFAALRSASRLRYGIVQGEFKFVVTEEKGIGRGKLTRRGRDEVDITAAAPQIVGPMRKRLKRIRARVLGAQQDEMQQEISNQDRDQLRALGYVEEPAEK